MIIIYEQLYLWAITIRRRKKKKEKDFQVGYIHNPVKLFWLLTLIMRLNVGNNLTTNNASNILSLSMFPYEN